MEYSLETVLDSTHDALIMIDRTGKVVIFNRAAEEITGIPKEQGMGKYILDIIPTSRLLEVLKTGEPELNKVQELGNRTVITNRMPVRDRQNRIIGALAVFRDIDEVKDLAKEITNLQEFESMFRSILFFAQDAISVVDKDGNGLYINPAYTRLTGFSENDVIGKPATVDIAEGESVHLQALKTRKPIYNATMKVGPARRDVVVNVAPIIIQGELKGSVAVIHDVSEILKLTEDLKNARQIIRNLEAKYTFDDIISTDPMMIEVIQKARRAAGTPATVLLRGENGTGKELFANAIHNESERRFNQFVRVNCGTIPEASLEIELFGCEGGTGAEENTRKGLFEEAHRGTIFLDEIGDLPLDIQFKLLRVLQEKKIVRVGGTTPIPVDVRVIAATNRNLERAVEERRFREDLYYRLSIVPVVIPPLRHHKADIKPLCQYYIRRFNQEYGRAIQGISDEAVEQLMAYQWPGNVRELENVIGRAIINMRSNELILDVVHLPSILKEGKHGTFSTLLTDGKDCEQPLDVAVGEFEKIYIERVLERNEGNRTQTAKQLGISIRNLYYKMEKYGIF